MQEELERLQESQGVFKSKTRGEASILLARDWFSLLRLRGVMFSRKTSTTCQTNFFTSILASGRALEKEGDSVTTYVSRTNNPEARRNYCTEKLLDRLRSHGH